MREKFYRTSADETMECCDYRLIVHHFVGSDTPAANFCIELIVLTDRVLFLTMQGYLGFGMRGLKVGDIVCVFHGSPTPHILRRVEGADEELYELIGAAFVYGIMNGQIDEVDIADQEFTLV
ncbi:hypothetical protein BCR34DRAFT_596390 [Clohesyomyces aquaticus]|uniref:Uncharacterized protein n=1 Tax=Clohesyomyces aquaticus TaxID=1231657 RepID=A0A1Y2A6M7_9PLEO|nr:hypothetical protein BCR34DRAFT_596390 [Clohesyomyces aquaticus]